MILSALDRGGYSHTQQTVVGTRLGKKGKHKVDSIAEKNGEKFIVSLKWQQTPGTAEEKVPYEVMCVADAIKNYGFKKGYVVLGGDKWTLRDFYTSGGLNPFLKECDKVEIVTLEQFVGRANSSKL